jgi:hypothetical protein
MPAIEMEKFIWVFNGQRSSFPSGLFFALETAESWISQHKLTGVLTKYPCDRGVYDHAIDAGLFAPKTEAQRTPTFIGAFSSAAFEHYHYEDGVRDA